MRLSGLTAKNRHGDGVRFRLVLSFRYFADGVVWTGYRQRGIFNDLARELLAIMLIPGWFAAAVQRRWACAERLQWTLRCRYYSAPAA